MRITNSIVTNNTKANININKLNQDRQNTLVASGQKIVRPSDDPVVAIRALRLNNNLSELNQYYKKNIPDAEAWFKTTETALTQTDTVITAIRSQLTQGASDDNTPSDRANILEELKQLRNQIYSTGNADYADRTVFTGYRTGETLTYTEQETRRFNIFENLSKNDVETFTYISGKQEVNKADGVASYDEQSIKSDDIYRMRLAYDNLCEDSAISIDIKDEKGNVIETITPDIKKLTGNFATDDAIYTGLVGTTGEASYFIPETGELILSKALRDKLIVNKGDITVNYDKEKWVKGDLKPEHYFMCSAPNEDKTKTIEYNYNRIDDDGNIVTTGGTIQGFKEQTISYEIAFNQSIDINTHASDVYKHDLGRDIDDLVDITEKTVAADEKIVALKAVIADLADTDPNKPIFEKNLEAATKERELLKDCMQKMFSGNLTSFADYAEKLNKQIANCGAMRARLELTKNRVSEQQLNFKELADDNINIDLSEAAIDLTSASNALEAAQLAAGKISKQTLLNYI